jgi:hypothetical protein
VAGRKIGSHLDGDGPLGGFEDQCIFGDCHARFSGSNGWEWRRAMVE